MGSIPFMLISVLGLKPDASGKRLTIVEPQLPRFVDSLELRGVRVGAASVDLAFERALGGDLAARVVRQDGELDVIVEPAGVPQL